MSDLTAIDVLIDPDEATMERARAVNARMLQSLPQGWALDDTHQPPWRPTRENTILIIVTASDKWLVISPDPGTSRDFPGSVGVISQV